MAGLAAVSLVAVAQMTSHVSRAATPAQAAATTGFVAASGLKPGEQIAVASNVSYSLWAPQAFEVSWTELEFFNPAPGTAGRDGRGRGGLASRPARVGQLAARPGRVAHRRRQPGRRLGGVAALVRTGLMRRVTDMRDNIRRPAECYTFVGGVTG